jgi:hypothetical protein
VALSNLFVFDGADRPARGARRAEDLAALVEVENVARHSVSALAAARALILAIREPPMVLGRDYLANAELEPFVA